MTNWDFYTIWSNANQTVDYPVHLYTMPGLPEVSTLEATNTTSTSPDLNADLTYLGGAPSVDVHFEWGEEGTGMTNTTTAQNLTYTQAVSQNLSGLSLGTTYEFRVAATNATGTVYGDTLTFKLSAVPNAPTNPFPADSATETLTSPTLSVDVSDPDGDTMDVSFYKPLPSDSFEVDLGSWVNDPGNAFDWTRNSGSTGSSGTGPSSAYDGSYYIYVETSSSNSGDTDIIEYDFGSSTDSAISFYYHQYGSDQGTLYLEGYNGSSWSEIWSSSGDQGDQWINVEQSFSGFSKVRFRNVAAGGYRGDISLDQISFDGIIGTDTGVVSGSTASVSWSGLVEETSYNWYAVADDGAHSAQSSTWSFTTGQGGISTSTPTNIDDQSAQLNGSLNNLEGEASLDVYFEWGTDTGYGNTTTNQTLSSPSTFNSTISSFSPKTTYHYRAVATNGVDFWYGDDVSFTTRATPPDSKIAILKGTNPADLNQTTPTALQWNSSQNYNTDAFSWSSGENTRLIVEEAGDYLLSTNIPQNSAVARSNIIATI
jgi:hypothetical protein